MCHPLSSSGELPTSGRQTSGGSVMTETLGSDQFFGVWLALQSSLRSSVFCAFYFTWERTCRVIVGPSVIGETPCLACHPCRIKYNFFSTVYAKCDRCFAMLTLKRVLGFSSCPRCRCVCPLDGRPYVICVPAPRLFVMGMVAGGGTGGGQQDITQGDGVGRCPSTQRRSDR